MKTCPQNRKLIALLAIDAIEDREARILRSHLDSCDNCQRYFEELSLVARNLAAAEVPSEDPGSSAFHERLVRRLEAEESQSLWKRMVERLRFIGGDWRSATAVIGASAAAIVMLLFISKPRKDLVSHIAPPTAPLAAAPAPSATFPSTLAGYELVANRSLDQLDEILTEQANRNPAPAPVYTPTALSRSGLSD